MRSRPVGWLVEGGRMLTVCSRSIPGTPTKDEAGDLSGGLLVEPGKDMAIGVHRDRDVGVAQALAHHLGRDANSQRRGSVAVAHIMQPDPWQPSRPHMLPEPV